MSTGSSGNGREDAASPGKKRNTKSKKKTGPSFEPQYDADDIFATAHLDLDRIKTGDRLNPPDSIARCQKDKRLMFGWHAMLEHLLDKFKRNRLAKDVASCHVRHLLFRPSAEELEAMNPHQMETPEARFKWMNERLRRKFEDQGLIAKEDQKQRRASTLAEEDLEWEHDADVEGLNDSLEDNRASLKVEFEQDHNVADQLHEEEEKIKMKEQLMRMRDLQSTKNLEWESKALLSKTHKLRDMQETTMRVSNSVNPSADQSQKVEGSIIQDSSERSTSITRRSAASLFCSPSDAQMMLGMNLQWDGQEARYLPGCGRKLCQVYLGHAHHVVDEVLPLPRRPRDRTWEETNASPRLQIQTKDLDQGTETTLTPLNGNSITLWKAESSEHLSARRPNTVGGGKKVVFNEDNEEAFFNPISSFGATAPPRSAPHFHNTHLSGSKSLLSPAAESKSKWKVIKRHSFAKKSYVPESTPVSSLGASPLPPPPRNVFHACRGLRLIICHHWVCIVSFYGNLTCIVLNVLNFCSPNRCPTNSACRVYFEKDYFCP
jgi:hypothetical protein